MGIRRARNERGQVAILFALVFTFMFVLFCFVVDFSHLITAKMNLQLAADSAAYAGAAWQARSLNRIAMINYHIRQDLKELAMRVQVTHLRHNRNFPRGQQFISGPDQAPNVEPFICQQAHGYKALSGLRYANDTNLCRNASPSTGGLPPIVVPSVIAAFDPFAVAIAAQIRKIAEAANQECRAAARDNETLAQHLVSVYTARTQFHQNQMQQVAAWMNETGSGEVSQGDANPVRSVAWESAHRNLVPANRSTFKMEIMQPQGGSYIQLNPNTIRGSLFFINFTTVGDGCVGRPSFVDFDGMSAGVTKEQPIITYFAVKLSAKPDLLMMPQAWADSFPLMEAFAAAKPFGSRIGPDSTADKLVPVANRPGNNNRMINFSFKPNDQLGIMNTKIMAYLDSLHPFNAASRPDGNRDTGWPDPSPQKSENLRGALQAIRSPTIFDAMTYTIFPDPNVQQDYLEPQYAAAGFPDYLEAGDVNGSIITLPQTGTAPYMKQLTSTNNGAGWIQINAPASAAGAYGDYASEAIGSHSTVLAAALPGMSGKENEFGFATREQVHSGWAPDGGVGRIGYSVKFIGLDALERTMIVKQNDSGSTGRIANPPTGDPNLKKIYH